MELCETLTQSKVVFVNYLSEDCTYMLKKLLSLADLIFEHMKVLIISLPPDSTSMEQSSYFARRLCQAFYDRGGELQIFFIRHEDKQDYIQRVFKRDKKHFTLLSESRLSLSLSEGTLLYAWGSANKGKLGLS